MDALEILINDARRREYRLGQHDCFTFACAVIYTKTGREVGKEFVGLYATREEAVALIERHGETFEEAFDWCFGLPRIKAHEAVRGDIMVLREPSGEKHLAVCVGAQIACLTPDGLAFLSRSLAHAAWRVR